MILIFSLIINVLLAGIPSEVRSQDVEKVQDSNLKALYFTGGLGAGSFGVGGQIGFTVDFPIGEFTLRYAGFDEYNFFSHDRVNDISLLYGLRNVKGRIWYDVAGGMGRAWYGRGECTGRGGNFSCHSPQIVERHWGMGLAFQSTIGWRHVGVSAFGNINNVGSFAAVTLNLHIGKVR